MAGRLTPFALWRSRLPAQIGTWFARDLTRSALDLVDGGRVALRSVEPARDRGDGQGPRRGPDRGRVGVRHRPQALRSVCTCGASGVCEHVVATLETVRTRRGSAAAAGRLGRGRARPLLDARRPSMDGARARARSVWPVLSVGAAGARRGDALPRHAAAARRHSRRRGDPRDDGPDAGRRLGRRRPPAACATTRSRKRSGRAPRPRRWRARCSASRATRALRFDDAPGENRHPSELRAVRGRAARRALARACAPGSGFVPVLETPDGSAHLAGRRGRDRRSAGLARGRPHRVPARRRVRPAQSHRRGARPPRTSRRREAAAVGARDRAGRAVPDRRRPRRAGRRRRRAAVAGGAGAAGATARCSRGCSSSTAPTARSAAVQPARRGDGERRPLRALPARGRARLRAALPRSRLRAARRRRLRAARRRPRGRRRAHPVAVVGRRRSAPRRVARGAGRRQQGRRQRHARPRPKAATGSTSTSRSSSAAASRSPATSCARCSAPRAATPKCAASWSTSATCARARTCSPS